MPNHIHAVVIINNEKIPYLKRVIPVGTWRAASLQQYQRHISQMQGWVSVVIGGIKSSVTRFAHRHQIPFAWQTRFYDHIIRNTGEMNRIAKYIENNVSPYGRGVPRPYKKISLFLQFRYYFFVFLQKIIMSDKLFRNKYRNATARAKWHDYNGGKYFITICTKHREHYFGEISSPIGMRRATSQSIMHLSEIGRFADDQFRNVQAHYPYAEIPLWVVMPNHIHLIVIIDKNVGTMCTSSLPKNDTINQQMQIVSRQRGLLSTTIGGIKRAVTRFAHRHQIPFAWQSRFHDRIIRNTGEMNRIAEYIENNVAQWDGDEFCDVSL